MNKSQKTVTRSENKQLRKVHNYIKKNWVNVLSCVVLLSIMCVGSAFAKAESMWSTLTTTLTTWIERLGGMIIFVGGVQFGLGWKREDADGKSQGISTIIAGAIIVALCAVIGTFI